MSPTASIAILGPLQVEVNGEPLTLSGERSRRILASLVEAGADGAGLDRLAELVWDDDDRPAEPTAHVRTAISRLRRQFTQAGADGATLIEQRPGGYRLGPEISVDAWSFQDALSPSHPTAAADPDQRLVHLDWALEPWRGEPYTGLEDLVELLPARTVLNELRLAAEEERLGLLLDRGEPQRAAGRAGALAAAHPWREELQRLHALSLYRTGRQTEALAVLSGYAQRARDELGLEPGPELAALEQAILSHDQAISVPTEAGRALRGYRLHEVLYRSDGPVGAVRRRATQPALDRTVTIETISLGSDMGRAEVAAVAERARRRASVRHRHVEPVVDHWREPGSIHVVAPAYALTLGDELASGPLAPARAAEVAVQLGSALDAIHDHGLIHGAIDPGAVFVDGGVVRLGCFPPLVEPDPGPDPGPDLGAFARVLATTFGGIESPGAAALLATTRQGDWDGRAGELARSVIEACGLDTTTGEGELAPDNPYPGLATFDESQAADFHGREAVVEELCRRFDDPGARLVVVAGASGTGKSSVLRAGLVPAVRAGGIEGSDRWAVAVMTPGSDPIDSLAEALAEIGTRADADPAAVLRDPPPTAPGPDPITAAIGEALGPDAELLLVIDQFEEVFTIPSGSSDPFLDLVAEALLNPDPRLRVAASLRADWLDRPLQRQPFAELFRTSVVPIAPLTADELERAIMLPALERGVELAPELRSRLVGDVFAERGALPLLGVALHELWAARGHDPVIDLDHYQRLGGLTGALVGRAEALVDELGPDGADELRLLLGLVVTVEPDRMPTRRTTPLAEIIDRGVGPATVDAAIAARVVSVDQDPSTREPMITVSHETILDRWPRLAGWLRDDRAQLVEHGRLADAAEAWARDGRDPALLLRGARLERARDLAAGQGTALSPTEADLVAASEAEHQRLADHEQRQARRRRNLTVTACLIAVAAVVASVVAVVNGRRAEQAAATAEVRLLIQSASTQFDERPALGLHLALGALTQGGGGSAEAVLIDLLDRSSFDRYLGVGVDTQCMALSPDPARPAVASLGTMGADGRVSVTQWDLATGASSPGAGVVIPHVPCPVLAPGGDRMAGVDHGTTVFVTDLTTGERVATVERDEVRLVEWTLDGSAVVALTGPGGGRLEILDGETLAPAGDIELSIDFVAFVTATGPDGIAVVTSDARPPVVIDLVSGRRQELEDPGERVIGIATTMSGDLIIGRSDRNLLGWDGASGELLWSATHGAQGQPAGPVVVSEQGRYVATTGSEGVVIVSGASGSAVGEPLRVAAGNSHLGFVGDESLMVTGPGDRLYLLAAGGLGDRAEVVHDDASDAVVAPDGAMTTFVGEGADERAVIVDPEGEITVMSEGQVEGRHVDADTVVGYEIEERRFVVWTGGKRTAEVDLSDRVPEGSHRGRTVRVGHGLAAQLVLQEPPDFTTMRLFVFDAESGELLADLAVPDGRTAEPVGPDRVALADAGFGARIIDLSGEAVHRLEPFGHPISVFTVANNGDLLVGLGDGSIHRHHGRTLERFQSLTGPPSGVWQILPIEGGFVTVHQNGDVVKWYDRDGSGSGGGSGGGGRPVVVHAGRGIAGFGSVSADGKSVLMPVPGQIIRVPIDRETFVAEACRRAGTDIDLQAWRALTTTDPQAVVDLCRSVGPEPGSD